MKYLVILISLYSEAEATRKETVYGPMPAARCHEIVKQGINFRTSSAQHYAGVGELRVFCR
jgi:hypothetical protein